MLKFEEKKNLRFFPVHQTQVEKNRFSTLTKTKKMFFLFIF